MKFAFQHADPGTASPKAEGELRSNTYFTTKTSMQVSPDSDYKPLRSSAWRRIRLLLQRSHPTLQRQETIQSP